MQIKLINTSNNPLPEYKTKYSAGIDLCAKLDNDLIIKPLQRVLIPTGLFMELPVGYEAQIRPRSGLAIKSGITVLNTPGTIDADYRGEIKVVLINLSDADFTVHNGDRICQMVIARYEQAEILQVETLSVSDRGEGGFGHTGV